MKKIKWILFLVCLSCLIWVHSENTYAVVINNNGLEMENPYGDSGIQSSYADIEYYDVFIPYKLTHAQIGGYATGYITNNHPDAYGPMAQSTINNCNHAYFVNWEGDGLQLSNAYSGGSTLEYEADTGAKMYKDANGNLYYVTAIQKYFYNASAAYYAWGPDNRGNFIDVYLSDGTILHFVVGDANAHQHCNNLPSDTYPGDFDIAYTFAPLHMEQYRSMYQAQSGNMLEIWGRSGCASNVANKYNLGEGEDQNKIVMYRMYNSRLRDGAPTRTNGKEVATRIDNFSIGSNASGGSSLNNVTSSGVSIIPESSLTGMPGGSALLDDASTVLLPDRNSLSTKEILSVEYIGTDLAENSEMISYENARILIVFIGMCFVLYAVLLILCMMFDKVNSFIEISLVKVISFGVLEYSDDEETRGMKGYTNTKKLMIVSLIVAIVGFFLISGGVLPFMMRIVYNVVSKFT